MPLDVYGLVLRERVKIDREHRLRVKLVAKMLLDLLKLLLVRHLGLVRDRLDRFLRLLHDILVLETFDIVLLALHVRVEKSASLQKIRTDCLPSRYYKFEIGHST